MNLRIEGELYLLGLSGWNEIGSSQPMPEEVRMRLKIISGCMKETIDEEFMQPEQAKSFIYKWGIREARRILHGVS